ncbi:uncharacterized protein LOC100374676 [Saccoglossus kowalevskii]|uniref:Ankyrin repeat and KH domain-containing protein mask-like n=1 Tax=Saccoglossus kowalevskii TaxID=10224 RepID=A0ABM0GPP1_SACKO|nr:PREDICTED: ankyrin repeat and KH domain-containing protein mask-like [Saccoglossus kowalevskii]
MTSKKSKKQEQTKVKLFPLKLKSYTNEVFHLKNIHHDMSIRELKKSVEFVSGIPSHLQRLTYLDEGDLTDETDIKYHDIVPGATILLNVWNMWKTLVEAAAEGDSEKVFALGVTQDTTYSTPNSQQMYPRARAAWIEERAFIALTIAAHRGYTRLVTQLIDAGANVLDKTPSGRTALHISAAQGKNNCVEILLNRGAKIDDPDEDGSSPLTIAAEWGHKSCERQIFLYQWQQRAATQKAVKDNGKMMAHQVFDSKTPTWIKGDKGQLYYAQILPEDEFSGTHLSSPKKLDSRPSSKEQLIRNTDGELDDVARRARPISRELTFYLEEGIVRPGKDGSREGSAVSQRSDYTEKKRSQQQQPGLERSKSFDQWLAKKKAAEQHIRDRKQRQKEEKKLQEDDDKRANNEKEKSYDEWLKDQKSAVGKGQSNRPVFGGQRGRSAGHTSPIDRGFDLLKLRKEMDIFNTVPSV